MKIRLIASGVVFVMGFGIGLGVTYALLAKKPEADQASGDQAEAMNEMEQSGLTDTRPAATDKVPSPAPTAPEAVEPAAKDPEPTPRTEPAADANPNKTGEGDTNGSKTPGANAASKDGEDGKVEGKAPPEKPEPETPTVQPQEENPPPAKGPWWKNLTGKKCKVDLGMAKALTIRKGELKDGATVNWRKEFGGNPRIGLLYANEDNIVTVHAVGTSAGGAPVAARVTLDKQGRRTTGIIALHTQGLKVTLYPVDAAATTP